MFVRTNNPSAMSSGKEEVTVIDHFLRRKTRRILLKRNDVFEGRFVLRDKTRLAWHGSRRLAVVSLNAGEIYVSGDEFRENGWPRGKNVDSSPRIYPSVVVAEWKGKGRVQSLSEYIHLSGHNSIVSGQMEADFCEESFSSNVSLLLERSKLMLSRLFDRLAFTGYGARLEINGIRMCPK